MSNLRNRDTQRDRKANFYPDCTRIRTCTPQFREVCNQPEAPDGISEMLWKRDLHFPSDLYAGRKARGDLRDA